MMWRSFSATCATALLFPISSATARSSATNRQCLRNDFIPYKCGGADVPLHSLTVDVLFDYEISMPHYVQAGRLLPELEERMLDDLARTLGCRTASRRRLRSIDGEEALLGYRSSQGSDAIDGEKGSCSKSRKVDEEKCVPVTGHITAFLWCDASADAVLAAKNVILRGIRDGMASNSYSNITKNIVYVGEHANDPAKPVNTAFIITVIVLLAVSFGAAVFVADNRERESINTFIDKAIAARAILFGAAAFVAAKGRRKEKNGGVGGDEREGEPAAPTAGRLASSSPADQGLEGEVRPAIEGASSGEESFDDGSLADKRERESINAFVANATAARAILSGAAAFVVDKARRKKKNGGAGVDERGDGPAASAAGRAAPASPADRGLEGEVRPVIEGGSSGEESFDGGSSAASTNLQSTRIVAIDADGEAQSVTESNSLAGTLDRDKPQSAPEDDEDASSIAMDNATEIIHSSGNGSIILAADDNPGDPPPDV